MNKHLTNLTAFHSKTSSPVGSWYSALKSWSEAHRSRREARKRDEILSQLTPQILYDIGEIDFRPRHSKSDVWERHPYRLLMDAIMPCGPSKSDPRR